MNVIKPCGDSRSQLTRGIRPYAPCHHRDLALLATTRPTTRRQPGCHEIGHILRLVTLVLRVSQAEEKEGGKWVLYEYGNDTGRAQMLIVPRGAAHASSVTGFATKL